MVSGFIVFAFLSELAPPSNVHYSVTSYGTSEVTGDIEWNSSMDSSVDNFTITVSSLDGTSNLGTVASSPLEHVTLNYNTNYTIFVRSSNCAGSSIPGVILFMECECRFQIVYCIFYNFGYNYNFPIILLSSQLAVLHLASQ